LTIGPTSPPECRWLRCEALPTPLDRRTFLALLALGTVSGAVLPDLVGPVASAAGTPTAARRAAERGVDGVTRLGRSYLRDHADERDAATLRSMLPGIDPARPVLPQLPDLVSAVVDDFGAGRVVDVDGWHLAVTEARASAAVALGA
jgi:hypothetical protein